MIDELSIVIPALNEERYLPHLLESLAAQTYAGKMEVILVDGQSRDGTVQVAQGYAPRLPDLSILPAKANVGHQRNVGAAAARYRYLLFLDADVVLPPELISDVVQRVDARRAFVVSVMHTGAKVTWLDRLFLGFGFGFVTLARLLGAPPAIGDFLLTSRAQHEKIGGFVEGALLGEDTDYGLRSVKLGARFYFFWRLRVIGSDRRLRLMGRRRLFTVWTRAFVRVVRRGRPVFPGEGYEYPFGHYEADEDQPVAQQSDLR